jgi:single-strand selective monofunctional uracil DNA glycosylase
MDPIPITRALTRAVNKLEFAEPVTHVYNPLQYAKKSQEVYLERFAKRGVEALFLGMNPGPFGMAQTGVPFGEVQLVREWIGIEEKVGKPKGEHPKRPITGFDCTRSEVSGRRLWGWASERFESAEAFFERFFVWNYCPLVFLEETGRNRTPDKLPVAEREPLFDACNIALRRMVEYCQPQRVIGVGKFAETRARDVLGDMDVEFGTILHPSPASPMANRGWAPQAEKQLEAMGIEI